MLSDLLHLYGFQEIIFLMGSRTEEKLFPDCVFSCTICADCCKDAPRHRRKILMLEGEVLVISEKIGRDGKEFALKSNKTSPYEFKMRKVKGSCVFLKKDNLCEIYDARPLVCKFFPFELKRGGKWGISGGCEGVGLGKKVPKKVFRDLKKLAEARFSGND